jgi:hypothetical protein
MEQHFGDASLWMLIWAQHLKDHRTTSLYHRGVHDCLISHSFLFCQPVITSFGGGGWIRTNVGVRQQIYSLPPLATRAPLQPGLMPFVYGQAGLLVNEARLLRAEREAQEAHFIDRCTAAVADQYRSWRIRWRGEALHRLMPPGAALRHPRLRPGRRRNRRRPLPLVTLAGAQRKQ